MIFEMRNITISCPLLTMVSHLVIYFPKIYHSGEEGALIIFVYIQIRHPSHSSPSVFVQHLKARVIVVGGEQNRPKDNPCLFFLRFGLSFFKG